MGLAISRQDFSDEDFTRYQLRLAENLEALRKLFDQPYFGVGPDTIGAELEMSMVDQDGYAQPISDRVIADCNNENAQFELDSFNLEYNFTPGYLNGKPFENLQNQMCMALGSLDSFARDHHGRVVAIGILPTLRPRDLTHDAVTDQLRYHALARGLRKLKGTDFNININGVETLKTSSQSIAVEGANTSLQIHLRVNPDEFAASFNAAQMFTPLVLAVSANSPVFLDKLLWDETRVALFKQSLDTRTAERRDWRQAARVAFGHGWVRTGALELFEEAVSLYPPLLPLVDEERALEKIGQGELPALRELRLLQGTVWQWNRPIYDPASGGHLRIELRALPSGPTAIDMAANTAYLLGLILYYRNHIDRLLPAMPFRYAEYNFYRAAQKGLDAQLLWSNPNGNSPVERSVRDLIEETLPMAMQGLTRYGVHHAEAKRLLEVIEQRNASTMTGARWQRQSVQAADANLGRPKALQTMLAAYMERQAAGEPVGTWTL